LRWPSWEPFQREKGGVEVSEKEKKLRKMATMKDKEKNMRICQRMNIESRPNIKYSPTRPKYEEAPSFQYLRKPKGRTFQIQKLNDITSRISRHDYKGIARR
jgi:predicted MarR family transcription regulator